jgi:hypothetical protein
MKPDNSTIWILVLATGLLLQAGIAQETMRDVPEDIKAMPQFTENRPPTPLSTKQEAAVLDAVFLRFPDLNRHETMAFIREYIPDGSREFTLLSHRDLGKAMAMLIDLIGKSERLMNMQSRNPVHFAKIVKHHELERNIGSLAGELKALEALETPANEIKLRTVLSQSFIMKQDLMKADIEDLEQQLETLRLLLKKREDNREVIIDNRYLDIIGKLDHMKW